LVCFTYIIVNSLHKGDDDDGDDDNNNNDDGDNSNNNNNNNNKDRIAATMYPLGTWFVPGICVWLPCVKETMMMMMMIMMIIIIIITYA